MFGSELLLASFLGNLPTLPVHLVHALGFLVKSELLICYCCFVCMIFVSLCSLLCVSAFRVWSLSLDIVRLVATITFVPWITLWHEAAILTASNCFESKGVGYMDSSNLVLEKIFVRFVRVCSKLDFVDKLLMPQHFNLYWTSLHATIMNNQSGSLQMWRRQ